AVSRDTGELPRELSALLARTLDFPTRTAEHAMVPRSRIDVVTASEPVRDVLESMAIGHTRYPVVGDDGATLLGIIHLLDLLDPTITDGTADLHCRTAVVVPTTMPLPRVLSVLRNADDEMALVIDEYGGLAGALTIEDLAEELVGEIDDEHDTTTDEAVTEADGWLVP
ncbi:CBS domain-containing protein, partial [Mycolicibacter algericus]